MLGRAIAFLRGESGMTIVEYAVAGALVTIGVVTAFTNLGAAIASRINFITAAING